MNQEPVNLPSFPTSPSTAEAVATGLAQGEETLRQLARLEPPIGVAERVHYRLAQAQIKSQSRSFAASQGSGFWSSQGKSFLASLTPICRMQFAGAAVLTVAFAASGWGVYHAHHLSASQPANPLLPGIPSSSFGASGAERHPGSLTPIKVPPAHKKKPSPSRVKPAARATQLTGESGTSR